MGNWKPVEKLEKVVDKVDDVEKEIEIGKMVAICTDFCFKNKKTFKPSIGKIIDIPGNSTVNVEYYQGNWTTAWHPYNKPYTQILPTSTIVLIGFELDNGKLTRNQRKEINAGYTKIKERLEVLETL